MKCSQILGRTIKVDPDIGHLTADSRQVRPGSLFFCCAAGERADAFIREARARGAAFVVAAQGQSDLNSENPRRDYALACSRFWGEPQKEMQLVAVTGTNGKSSVSWLLRHILNCCSGNCGLMGTICNQIGNQQIPAAYTTPDAGQLYPLLAQMKQHGCRYVVMEASSQAIAQQRLAGLHFACGIFTNLSRDHLDQHGSMEQYFRVKRSLLADCDDVIVNQDDKYGRILMEEESYTAYSLSGNGEYYVTDCCSNACGSSFVIHKDKEKALVQLRQPGEFFVSNAAAALAAANYLGVALQDGARALAHCPPVPGRAELYQMNGFDVIIDYAHTSDGLENILQMAKQRQAKHIYVLFGCAGQRDRGDRKAMAQTVLRYAEKGFYTADNPRGEAWEQLCADIGYHQKLIPIFDRREAIKEALSCCKDGDLLLLLGKGHEEYQVYADKSFYFSEREILHEIIGRKPEKH